MISSSRSSVANVQVFQRGEFNKIRLANKAIAKFEAKTIIA